MQLFGSGPSREALEVALRRAERLDWPREGGRPGVIEESLGQKVNGRVALSFWGTLTGTVKGLIGQSQNQPQCQAQLNNGKWTFMGPTLYRSAPFINLTVGGDHRLFGSTTTTTVINKFAPASSSSNSKDKDKMDGGTALMFGLMGLAAVIGSIVLFFPASAQLMRDRALLKEVREGREELQHHGQAGNLTDFFSSTLRSYQDMEGALKVRVKQEMFLVGTDALLAISGVLGLTAAFTGSWWYGKMALASGCGTAILFTFTVMVGSSQEDRDQFFSYQNLEHQYRNEAVYVNNGQWMSRFGHTAATVQQMPYRASVSSSSTGPSPQPSAPPLDAHIPLYYPNLNSDDLGGFHEAQESELPQNQTPYFEDPSKEKKGWLS